MNSKNLGVVVALVAVFAFFWVGTSFDVPFLSVGGAQSDFVYVYHNVYNCEVITDDGDCTISAGTPDLESGSFVFAPQPHKGVSDRATVLVNGREVIFESGRKNNVAPFIDVAYDALEFLKDDGRVVRGDYAFRFFVNVEEGLDVDVENVTALLNQPASVGVGVHSAFFDVMRGGVRMTQEAFLFREGFSEQSIEQVLVPGKTVFSFMLNTSTLGKQELKMLPYVVFNAGETQFLAPSMVSAEGSLVVGVLGGEGVSPGVGAGSALITVPEQKSRILESVLIMIGILLFAFTGMAVYKAFL